MKHGEEAFFLPTHTASNAYTGKVFTVSNAYTGKVCHQFGATFVPPVLPDWVGDVWKTLEFSAGDSCVPAWAVLTPI